MTTQIISLDSDANLHESVGEFFLITSAEEAPEYAGFDIGVIKARSQGDSTLLSTPNDYHDTRGLLLTADSTVSEVQAVLDQALVNLFVIYVADFKDGRVFSLVRQLRKISEQAEIIIAGEFGVDQAAYFYKSGANGFAVSSDKVVTLKSTLDDLKTAHAGTSAGALPMFR
ncbi:DUF934 domain-containing protein [Moraxella nasibovis]|uniref:DUF934 domain-containing protein n=1 Tax=Moraxella nasibovis TaxID=2904120 RepID=UPI00240FC0F8|nr:DUF934 domain-containing protein [Moraxella nasibovis]WFF39383.1 DUF934 domain-containing protein [Moraxella nasibovis]